MGVHSYSFGGFGFIWNVCENEVRTILKAVERYAVKGTSSYRITYDLLYRIIKNLEYDLDGELPEKAKGNHLILYHDDEGHPDDFYCFVDGTYFEVEEGDDIQMDLPPKRKVELMKEVLETLDFTEGRMKLIVMTRCF